jgi:hypothetical protein
MIFGDMKATGDVGIPDFEAFQKKVMEDVVSQGLPTDKAAHMAAASLQSSGGVVELKKVVDN